MLLNKVLRLTKVLCSKNGSKLFWLWSSTSRNEFHTSLKLNQNASDTQRRKIKSTLYYITAAGVLTVGLSYAAVPLYRMFCQAYSYGGTTAAGHDVTKIEHMNALKHRPIKVRFNADLAASMRWNFKPQQSEITVSCISHFVAHRQ